MNSIVSDNECCGFPEMGVCPRCPDPDTVAWGKKNEVQIQEGLNKGLVVFAGTPEMFKVVHGG